MNDPIPGGTHASHPSGSSQMPTLDPTTASEREKSILVNADDLNRPALTKIGPYKLLQVVGEGGFGTVWIADQSEPVKRRVALKIIKPGMDSKAVIARFEQERQALAMMDHPNIAKVFDAGTASDGRPYFVMEYVAGESITSYCDKHRLSMQQRLELFIPVCEAVQHAHHKGVIHRDIKPGNVMVCSVTGADASGDPLVKVIDFGVAKAVSHVLTDKTLFTEMGQILGTPEYMSPEQAEMGALDIDTRTDVYALGVLLYELLAGALPFEPKDLRSRGYNEIQRIIREVDPPRPSNRLRSLGGAASAEVAKRRQIKLEELEGQLRRELEWIPLKAMRKDRDQRYATPNAMADDIRNHLAGRPLTAGPESISYKMKKFVYRNRYPAAAAAAVVLALTLGAIASTIGFVKAANNAKIARAAEVVAKSEADRANVEAARQRQINMYTRSLFFQANPFSGEPRDVPIRLLLDEAVGQLDRGAQAGQPRVEAAIRAALAHTYESLSQFAQAHQQWQIALQRETESAGDDSPEAAAMMSGLAHVKLAQGKLDEAELLLRRAVSIQREQLAADDRQLADTLNYLGILADARGDFQAAHDRFAEALKIYQQHPEDLPSIADSMTNLATVYHKTGENKKATELATKALELRRQRFKPEHMDIWHSLINLASMKEADDDLAGAETMRRDALALAEKLLDEKHRRTVESVTGLARTLWLRGGTSLEEAQKLGLRAATLASQVDGNKSLEVARAVDLLGCIARDRGDLPLAAQLFKQGLDLRESILTRNNPDTTSSMLNLADVLARQGQAADAIALADEALQIRRRILPADHWTIWNASSVLGAAYAAAGQFDQAEPLLLESFKGLESGSVLGRRPRIDTAQRLATLYDKWGKPDQSKEWSTRAQTIGAIAGN